jgi:uncharacterized membrane protein YecN with MAPEG domain
MNVYLVCSGILVLLYFLLAFNVSLTRGREKTGIGSGSDPSGPLNKSIRIHGNASEYIPLFVALFLYFNSVGASGWVVWVVVLVTICRFLHAIGMQMSRNLNRAQPLRFVGSLGTYLGGFALGVELLRRAI